MSDLTLRAWNFRGIQYLDWSPRGVCLLSGPNGAGKSTTLGAFRFVRAALVRGVKEALRYTGGAEALRSFRSVEDADVVFEIEAAGVIWRLEIPIEGSGVHSYHGERLTRDGKVVLDVPRLQKSYTLAGQEREREEGDRTYINTLLAADFTDWLRAFRDRISQISMYAFDLRDALFPNPGEYLGEQLHSSGGNLVHVLRGWQGAPRQFGGQFEWVLGHLKGAFPRVLEDIEFLPEGRAVFYPVDAPDPDTTLPLHLAPEGLIAGLLQLTAVAGAKEGSLLGFDEMENQLHPHAIRTILAAMRERAEKKDLSILLTTHSPVVMNAFKGYEDQFYVLEPTPARALPVPLTEVRDPEWLAHFALGDLYEREEFASPRAEAGG